MSIPPRFPITAEQINTVVAAFYHQIRQHPVLGPVFFETVPDEREIWEEHEEKIARFWRNAILFERSYDGNPQRVHSQRPAVKPEHFALWLDLFDETLKTALPDDLATSWSALAHRIGAGLRMGVVQSQQRAGAVPNLLG
ncbi:MAG: group III truncated hemoglobin [Rhodobacteraceae bacterium]|nr:group III truncated hemoglobin [Paracoccaceae bacterium]